MTKNRFDFRGIQETTKRIPFLIALKYSGEWNFFFNVFFLEVCYSSGIK